MKNKIKKGSTLFSCFLPTTIPYYQIRRIMLIAIEAILIVFKPI